MDNLMGVLKVKVIRGINLVVMDSSSSDPYVIISMGLQQVKTRTINNDCNPEWDDEVSIGIQNLDIPIKLSVYDKDIFTGDDYMGEAIIDIRPYVQFLRTGLAELDEGTIVHKVSPDRENCLAKDSPLIWENGKLVQKMIMRLNNVRHGKVEIQLEWVDIPGCRGLGSYF